MADDRDPTPPDSPSAHPFSASGEDIPFVASAETRRAFLKKAAGAGAALTLGPEVLSFSSAQTSNHPMINAFTAVMDLHLKINGREYNLKVDPRTSLLDLLRERLQLTGSKKGCDHGQCGACTVLVNGRRVNSCLSLALVHEGDQIITIEGLAKGDQLHPMQAAFLDHDAFQCGYCTPGQICSAVACVKEGHAGDDLQIREWMSGNLCRCGAYPNIVEAIKQAGAQLGGEPS
jgi:xanthine dehydrogenase YagT iron-sulfur-binding subunit